jgi:hypothetical protein
MADEQRRASEAKQPARAITLRYSLTLAPRTRSADLYSWGCFIPVASGTCRSGQSVASIVRRCLLTAGAPRTALCGAEG